MPVRSSSSVEAITSPFQTSILLDGLSGSFGAPQGRSPGCSCSASVGGVLWRGRRYGGAAALSGWFEAGREPGAAVEQGAERVEFAEAPFGGGGQVGLDER